ncbi:MAG: hypothetical protein SFY66_00950 [Oculatellaceae cyanobacterium bins.114]|nr:hypothetical protein [Oculatellaceae cyanobacterium bins.114]
MNPLFHHLIAEFGCAFHVDGGDRAQQAFSCAILSQMLETR